MEELTELGTTITSINSEEIKLDRNIKNILAYKPILARIFKESVTECKEMMYNEIEECIEGDISIDVVGLNPGTSKIEGQLQEDAVPNEGKVTFDIRTTLRIPNSNLPVGVKLLVDVEAQKDDSPGYDISERAIYYSARMISSQLSTEFTNSSADTVKYGNLKKVYSIWICTETSQAKANTIERYTINRSVSPKKDEKEPRYDLLEAVIINISAKHDTEGSENKLINLLTELFNEEIDGRDKVKMLKERYDIQTTVEFEKEVINMTAYTARIIREGMAKGMAKGMAEGRIEERIQTLLEFGKTPDECVLDVAKKFELTEDEARAYVDKYSSLLV